MSSDRYGYHGIIRMTIILKLSDLSTTTKSHKIMFQKIQFYKFTWNILILITQLRSNLFDTMLFEEVNWFCSRLLIGLHSKVGCFETKKYKYH